jgi:tetratricopeptide (TPR) repeat protein
MARTRDPRAAWRGKEGVAGYLDTNPTEEEYRAVKAKIEAEIASSPDDVEAILDLTRLERGWAQRHAPPGSPQGTDRSDLDALYRRALAIDPNHAPFLSDYASFLEQSGRSSEALARLDQLAALGREQPQDRLLRAGLFLKLGRVDETRAALEALRSELPGGDPGGLQVQVLQLLGRAYTELGMHEQAESVLIEALTHDQGRQGRWNPACAYTALGELYRLEGSDGAGLEQLVKAAEIEPGNAWIQYEAALFAYYANDLEAARRYLARAEALEDQKPFRDLRAALDGDQGRVPKPGFDAALRAFARHDYAQAEQFLAQVLQQAPSSDAHTLHALLLVLRRSYPEARAKLDLLGSDARASRNRLLIEGHLALVDKDYARSEAAFHALDTQLGDRFRSPAMITDPDPWTSQMYVFTHLGLAWSAANQDRHELAIEHFARVLERKPAEVFALIGKGNSLNALGDLDGAEAALRRVLEADPGNAYAQAELGMVAYNRGQDEQAETAFHRALQLDPGAYTCPHEGLGLLYLRQGRLDEAQGAFQRAIEINPDIEYLKYNGLARIYIDQGRFDEAQRLLTRSLENAPWAEETRVLQAELQVRRAAAGAGDTPIR